MSIFGFPGVARWSTCVVGLCMLFGAVGPVCPGQTQSDTASQNTSYVQHQWTIQDGLPVNSVKSIQRGPQGYLWLSTYDGLVRFDGKEWTVYRSATESSLPGNRFGDLVRGPGDHLWTALESGELVRVEPHTETFRAFSPETSPLPGAVTKVRRDGEVLWVGTNQGLAAVRDGRLHQSPLDDSLSVLDVVPGADSRLWVGTDQGLYVVRKGTSSLVPTADGPQRPPVVNLNWTGTRLWAASLQGVYTLRDGRLHRPFSDEATGPRSAVYVHEDTTGTLWVGTDDPETGGLYVRRDGRLRSYKDASFEWGSGVRWGPHGHRWILADNVLYRDGNRILTVDGHLRDLFFDREGNVWVATSRDGIYRLRRSLFTIYGTPEGLASNNIYALHEDRSNPGTLWVGTLGGGLARLRNGTVRTLGAEENVPGVVWALEADRTGKLWVGGQSDLCFLREDRCIKRGLPPILANRRTVRAIYEDNQGRLWVGTANNGLYRRRGDTWTHLAPNVSARIITQTRNGSLWMGTNGRGLFRYRNGEFDQVTPEDGLSSALVRAIHEDSTGALWIGTEDKGLNRIDRQGTLTLADDSIAVIRKSDGLFDNVISQILPDGHGRLWMSSNRGLFWVRRAELHAVADGQADRLRSVSYTEAEGLRNREANGGMQPAGIRASSGALWFPTQEGAVRIHPDSLSTNDVPPPIVIERIVTDSTSHKASAPVQLPVGVRNFEVAFAGLKLSNPDALTFRYRLRGFEGQGPQVTERRRATYTNVPPGRYTFEVRARTDRGVRSPAPATVRIEIPPHWWETRWFYMLCGLGLLGLGLGAYQWRTQQLRRRQQELEETVAERTKQIRQKNDELAQQAEKLKELDEAKSRFFANLSHEFRTPLTLIRGPVQEVREHLARANVNLDEQAEQLAVVERNTDRLRRLVDQLLALARMDAGSYELAARPTNLGAEVQRIAQAFAPLAERNDLTLTVKAEETEAPEPVVVDREALEHILGNLLSNAIKFTPEGGRVTVTVTNQEEHAAMTVADTGPGIPEDKQDIVFERFERTDEKQSGDQEGVGIGLAFANDLVDLHGGSIDLDSAAGDGTRVTVRFPRGTAHLPDEHLATAPQEPDNDARPSSPTPDVSPSTDGAPASHTPSSADDTSPTDPEPAPRAPGSDEEPQRKVVLVVDDNADVRRYVRSILAPTYTVIEAAHGEEGLDQAREAVPDCILADVMMPTMDGVTMVRHLKSDRATAHLPIVMLTARAGTEHEIEGLEAGADDYVTKPFDADVLQARVAGMIEVRQRLRRRIRQELKRQSGDGQVGASSGRERSDSEEPGQAPAGGDQAREAAPPQLVVSTASEDEPAFVREVRSAIEERLADPDLSVDQLASAVAVSRSTLYRRLKKQVGATPSQFIQQVRVEHGARLLREEEGTISEVAYAVGFESLSYFSQQFREHLGQPPSKYVEAVR